MPSNVEQLVAEGAKRLVARAGSVRAVDSAAVASRVRATVEKYLLRHRPAASDREVSAFVDSLHAQELLLVGACARGARARRRPRSWPSRSGPNSTACACATTAGPPASSHTIRAAALWAAG